jgi:hypothetical protein
MFGTVIVCFSTFSEAKVSHSPARSGGERRQECWVERSISVTVWPGLVALRAAWMSITSPT